MKSKIHEFRQEKLAMSKKAFFLLIVFIALFFSCKNRNVNHAKIEFSEILLKIEGNKLNLSNTEIKKIPDLSKLEIIELDLSNNKIVSFEEKLLPKNLEILNISNNRIKDSFNIEQLKLERLNASNNRIRNFKSYYVINNLNISKNKLISVSINMPVYTLEQISADSLDISDNYKLDNHLGIAIGSYKVINRQNIKNNKPLRGYLDREYFD
jgi:hypothetical protein